MQWLENDHTETNDDAIRESTSQIIGPSMLFDVQSSATDQKSNSPGLSFSIKRLLRDDAAGRKLAHNYCKGCGKFLELVTSGDAYCLLCERVNLTKCSGILQRRDYTLSSLDPIIATSQTYPPTGLDRHVPLTFIPHHELLPNPEAASLTQNPFSCVSQVCPWIVPTGLTEAVTDSYDKTHSYAPHFVRRIRHPYKSRRPSKRKKPRTSFTRLQICELEKWFQKHKYLPPSERSFLAKKLKMTGTQVKTWFQNRRTKWRRQTEEYYEAGRQVEHNRVMFMCVQQSHHHCQCLSYLNLFKDATDLISEPFLQHGWG